MERQLAGNNELNQRSSDQARADKAFPVSWDQFHRDARVLAWRLNGAGPFQALAAVTRGGLVPAAIVARELGIRKTRLELVAACLCQATCGLRTQAYSLIADHRRTLAPAAANRHPS